MPKMWFGLRALRLGAGRGPQHPRRGTSSLRTLKMMWPQPPRPACMPLLILVAA